MTLSSDFMCWCGLQTIYTFLNCVDGPSKTGVMINIFCHIVLLTLPSHYKNRLLLRKCPQAGSICKQKKHVPVGGKRHHTNQSQNYIINHMIWLLRNGGSCGRDGDRDTDSFFILF